MLVYAKVPMGYTTIENKRVYGRFFSYGRFGPTEITYSLFIKNKELLEEVPYTSELLEKKFGCKFPPISFKLSEIRKVAFNDLVLLIRAFGIYYKDVRNPTIQEKYALRRAIKSRLIE